YEEAKDRLEEALTLANMLEIPRSMCFALEAKGTLALALCQTDTALRAFQEMRSLGPQGDFEVEVLSLYGMARSYEQMGDDDQARTFGEQALVLVRQKMMIRHEQRILKWYTRSLQPSTPTESESAICICGKTIVRSSGPGRTR